MSSIRSDSSTAAVDELKRRARRRLVGAIVLALAAAVIVPVLLESDPKPLGEDVSIQIPPIDEGKFVNPLSPAKAPEAKALEDGRFGAGTDPAAAAGAPAMTRRSIGDAERRVLGQIPPPAAPATNAGGSDAPASPATPASDGT